MRLDPSMNTVVLSFVLSVRLSVLVVILHDVHTIRSGQLVMAQPDDCIDIEHIRPTAILDPAILIECLFSHF